MPAVPPKRLRFGRAARIKQGRDFARARQEGQRCVCGCLIANWRVLPIGTSTRLGLVVSRKVGGAVVRSRARRLLRESFRLHQHDLACPVDLVLVARQSIARHCLNEVEKDFLTALKRAGLLSAQPEVRQAAPACLPEVGRRQKPIEGGCRNDKSVNPVQHILILAVRVYRWTLSPVLAGLFGAMAGCRFTPTCSVYALEALRAHGAARGAWLATRRLCRCHPWGGCGHDPVPPADFGRGTPNSKLETARRSLE